MKSETNFVRIEGSIIESSKTSPTDRKRIKKQIEKLGETPFISNKTSIESTGETAEYQ